MNKEERKAVDYFIDDIKYLKKDLKKPSFIGKYITILDKECVMLETLLNLIQKQEKVIDEMAQELINAPLRIYGGDAFKFRNKEDTKQYFYRKVKEDENSCL